jgi:hypothetical protein
MYDSPITLMVQKMAEQVAKELDEATFKAVELVMPTVNREELIKALRYDREQYDKGYADGKRDAMDELVRCKDCKHRGDHEVCPLHDIRLCFDGDGHMDEVEDDKTEDEFFCSYGERKAVTE